MRCFDNVFVIEVAQDSKPYMQTEQSFGARMYMDDTTIN